jgi:hypothetical protein
MNYYKRFFAAKRFFRKNDSQILSVILIGKRCSHKIKFKFRSHTSTPHNTAQHHALSIAQHSAYAHSTAKHKKGFNATPTTRTQHSPHSTAQCSHHSNPATQHSTATQQNIAPQHSTVRSCLPEAWEHQKAPFGSHAAPLKQAFKSAVFLGRTCSIRSSLRAAPL